MNYEPPKDPAARKKGAVIGAAPVLNPEGLLAAAHIAQEKELLRKQQVMPPIGFKTDPVVTVATPVLGVLGKGCMDPR